MPTSATIQAGRGGTLVGPEEVTGDQMVAAMDAVGVDGAILVSPFSMYGYDASYALEVCAKHPGRFGLVKPVDPNDPGVAETVANWAAKDGHGRRPHHDARQCLDRSGRSRPEPGAVGGGAALDGGQPAVLRGGWNRRDNWRRATRTRRSSSTISGCSSRSSRRRRPSRWADLPKVTALAAHPNVAIKISGACTLSHEPFPYRDIWEPLGRIFDAFGFDRCLWGTDWTRAVKLLTYKEGVEAFRVTDRLSDSDRAKLMGGSARPRLQLVAVLIDSPQAARRNFR